MFHGWMFDPDGDQAAADSTRSSTSLDTGSSVNPRTARRLVTASYMSIIHRLLAASHRHAGHEALWPRRLRIVAPEVEISSTRKPGNKADAITAKVLRELVDVGCAFCEKRMMKISD